VEPYDNAVIKKYPYKT